MQVIYDSGIVFFDVDGTLVRPAVDGDEHTIVFEAGNRKVYFTPIQGNIDSLVLHKARGHTVVVWSHGKARWAETAVKALGLESFVDYVVSKPDWIYDDEPPEHFLDRVIWHGEGEE